MLKKVLWSDESKLNFSALAQSAMFGDNPTQLIKLTAPSHSEAWGWWHHVDSYPGVLGCSIAGLFVCLFIYVFICFGGQPSQIHSCTIFFLIFNNGFKDVHCWFSILRSTNYENSNGNWSLILGFHNNGGDYLCNLNLLF